jgi:hypothetical protein
MTNEHVVALVLLKNIGDICTSNNCDNLILLYLPDRSTPEVSILGEEEAFFCYSGSIEVWQQQFIYESLSVFARMKRDYCN